MKVEDILPLDKGTSAYTSFAMDQRFVDYLIQNPEAMEWKVGLIHSHNTMAVFFSGTDLDELRDNAPNHNFYLSLIVNNFMEMTAKVALHCKAEQAIPEVPFVGRNENGDFFNVTKRDFKVDKELILTYDCVIQKPKQAFSVPSSFLKNVEVLVNPPKVETPVIPTFPSAGDPFSESWEGQKTSKSIPSLFGKEQKEDADLKLISMKCFLSSIFKDQDLIEVLEETLEKEDFEDMLLEVKEYQGEFELTDMELSRAFLDVYIEEYPKFFPEDMSNEKFVQNTNRISEFLEVYGYFFPFVKGTVYFLDKTVTNFVKNIQNGKHTTKI